MIYLLPERKNLRLFATKGIVIPQLSVKVDTYKIKAFLKVFLMLTLLGGYITLTILSYSISPVYFWVLIKAGFVLGFLAIIQLYR